MITVEMERFIMTMIVMTIKVTMVMILLIIITGDYNDQQDGYKDSLFTIKIKTIAIENVSNSSSDASLSHSDHNSLC